MALEPDAAWRGDALPREFYDRSAVAVARGLLGCYLVRRLGAQRSQAVAGRIVETEAYVGERDRACHAHAGRTRRNAVMYGPPGHAYVYLIYGMYDMMNVVCRPPDEPHAVLLRAVEPTTGLDAMRRWRRVRRDADLASGPGKLCRAFAITRALNGADLTAGPLSIVAGAPRATERIQRSARIGVEYAGPDAARPLRFFLAPNLHVSRR